MKTAPIWSGSGLKPPQNDPFHLGNGPASSARVPCPMLMRCESSEPTLKLPRAVNWRFLNRYAAGRRNSRAGGLRVGIGDDCALLRVRAGEELAVTTDLSIAGRHFRLDWHQPEAVGHRTLARGLSDLAAMGARPLAAFLSLGLPRELTRSRGQQPAWIERFYDGLLALAEIHETPLAGGDLSESPHRPCRHRAGRRGSTRTGPVAQWRSPRRPALCHRQPGRSRRRLGPACGTGGGDCRQVRPAQAAVDSQEVGAAARLTPLPPAAPCPGTLACSAGVWQAPRST